MSWMNEYLTMVEDCEKRESRLTEWEQGFIESLRTWIENEKQLTPKQIERLNTIWERATANG